MSSRDLTSSAGGFFTHTGSSDARRSRCGVRDKLPTDRALCSTRAARASRRTGRRSSSPRQPDRASDGRRGSLHRSGRRRDAGPAHGHARVSTSTEPDVVPGRHQDRVLRGNRWPGTRTSTCMNADGTDRAAAHDRAGADSAARAGGASAGRRRLPAPEGGHARCSVSLVPAYGMHLPNRTHGPPLASGSCSPPAPERAIDDTARRRPWHLRTRTVSGAVHGRLVRLGPIAGNPSTAGRRGRRPHQPAPHRRARCRQPVSRLSVEASRSRCRSASPTSVSRMLRHDRQGLQSRTSTPPYRSKRRVPRPAAGAGLHLRRDHDRQHHRSRASCREGRPVALADSQVRCGCTTPARTARTRSTTTRVRGDPGRVRSRSRCSAHEVGGVPGLARGDHLAEALQLLGVDV